MSSVADRMEKFWQPGDAKSLKSPTSPTSPIAPMPAPDAGMAYEMQPSASSSQTQSVAQESYKAPDGGIFAAQPAPTQGMQVLAGGNKNVKGLPYNTKGDRIWSNPLYSFYQEWKTCFTSCLCPCIQYSRNKSRYESLARKGVVHPKGGDIFTGDCALYGCFSCCICTACISGAAGAILESGMRGNVRNRYQIGGNGCGDCCTACCCYSCGFTQVSRELALEEETLKPYAAAPAPTAPMTVVPHITEPEQHQQKV